MIRRPPEQTTKKSVRTKYIEAAVLVFSLAAFAFAFTVFPRDPAADEISGPSNIVEEPPVQDYSKFQHTNEAHSRLPCLLCHNRDGKSPTIKRSVGHAPCAGCHVQQFSSNTSPMCLICHNPGSVAVKRFPPLRSFNVKFDHGRHVRQTNCATCHRPSRRGVALSIPSGSAAHNTCFQCHGPDTEIGGKNIGSCSTCHQLGRLVRTSESAKAFSMNFSHQEHGKKLNCAACHTIRAGTARGRQVSAPLPSMHFAPAGTPSCAACHNNKRAFGTGDFSNCKRCHEGQTFKF